MNRFKPRTTACQRALARQVTVLPRLAALLLLLPGAMQAAQAQEIDATLQGSWTVIAGEHGGRPMDSMNGGIMEVEGDRFSISTSSGTQLAGQLLIDRSETPATIVMQHDSGMEWKAIYEVEGDDFRMNYIDTAGPDPLPEVFRTTDETEATVVVLKRADA